MNKQEAVSFVMSLNPGKSTLGLQRISSFLEKTGNPQNRFPSFLITGTNGKGSTATYISSILQEAGHKVGTFTSPFLDDFSERIVVNGKKIPDRELARLVEKTKNELSHHSSSLSFFEFITAVAFQFFASQKVDVAVLEIGMGGRKDATNAVENAVGCAITNIGLEHTQYLGKTRKKIAWEKAGIIKKNSVVATTEQDAKIRKVFEDECKEKKASLLYYPEHFSFKRKSFSLKKQFFDFFSRGKSINGLEIKMLGFHQFYNASLAVVLLLAQDKFAVSEQAIRSGLKKAFIPGRFEIERKKPLVVLDACHNPPGLRAFANTFKENFPKKRAAIVFGCSSDKNFSQMLRNLKPIAEKIIVCRAEWRGMDTLQICKTAKNLGFGKVIEIPSVEKAVRFAVKNNNGIVCVCGSIFVLSEARKALKEC